MLVREYYQEGETVKQFVMRVLEGELLTEENTDDLISYIFTRVRLPWYVPTGIVKKVLDQFLPDVLLTWVGKALVSKGFDVTRGQDIITDVAGRTPLNG